MGRYIDPDKTIITDGEDTANVGANSALDVNVQSPNAPTVILPLAEQLGLAELTADTIVEGYDIEVDSVVGAAVFVPGAITGSHVRIINAAADRYYFGTILAINALVITVDSPIDFIYTTGSEVTYSNINMAVDGSGAPVHFHLRTGSPSIPSSVDITRMLMVCECDTAVDLTLFGDLPALTRGLVFRHSNSSIRNIWNVKTNKDLTGLAYDWRESVATNPAQGVDGFSWRLTFGGEEKMGTVLRVEQEGQLGIIVQDDLTGLVDLVCTLEGAAVVDN